MTLFAFESESGERHIEMSVMDFTACKEEPALSGTEAMSVKTDVSWSSASYQPLCVAVTNPPAALTGLAVCHNQL